jgi:HD-like signal output (HDOD) protein
MSLEHVVWALAALALLLGLLGLVALLRRKGRRGRQEARSTTQLAALRAASAAAMGSTSPPPAPAKTASPGVLQAQAADAAEAAAARSAAMQALQRLALGQSIEHGAASADASSTAQDDAMRLAIGARLEHIVEQPHYAPRRPMLLPKLMQAVSDETVSQREIVRILAGDPALAGNLLRLANSSYYRHTPDPIESLDRAVAILGIEGMRSMIAAALLQPIFRISGGAFAAFGEISWEHALSAGSAAEAHAAIVENSDPFAAQLLALLMGLATVVVFRVAQDEYLAHKRGPPAAALAALIDAQWVPVARQIATHWALSERIDLALAQQLPPPLEPASALGRSLQFGRYLGALAVLRRHGVIDDAAVQTALRPRSGTASGESAINPSERIWARLVANPR